MTEPLRVISLDRTPQRFAQFQAWNPGFDYVRYPAVDGAMLDRDGCIREGLIAETNRYSIGSLGNALSHIRLWQQCVAENVPVHIAEDDVILRRDFHAMAAALLLTLPQWDVVLWNHNFDWPVELRPGAGVGRIIMQYDPDHGMEDHDAFRNWTGAPALQRLGSAAGTGCYSVSPCGAARMLADCLPLSSLPAAYAPRSDVVWHNAGIDVEMCRHYANWQAYVAIPPLALAPNDMSASTIRGHMAAIHDPAIANAAIR